MSCTATMPAWKKARPRHPPRRHDTARRFAPYCPRELRKKNPAAIIARLFRVPFYGRKFELPAQSFARIFHRAFADDENANLSGEEKQAAGDLYTKLNSFFA